MNKKKQDAIKKYKDACNLLASIVNDQLFNGCRDWYWVCDSLDAIEILMEAEREFGVVIPDDRIEHIKTVREAIDLIMELDSI